MSYYRRISDAFGSHKIDRSCLSYMSLAMLTIGYVVVRRPRCGRHVRNASGGDLT